MNKTSMHSDYYARRLNRYLRQFDSFVEHVRGDLDTAFEPSTVPALIAEIRQSYAGLIPGLPYLGGKQPFTQFVLSTALELAIYRALRARGLSVEQSSVLIFRMGQSLVSSYPAFALGLFRFMSFSPFYKRQLRARAAESHQRRYEGGYVFDYVEGDGREFDYGVDYLECASCKYLAQQGASELAPYLCAADVIYSRALGWGLTRSTTLAEGFSRCDFRFKKGGPTRVAVPEALREVVG